MFIRFATCSLLAASVAGTAFAQSNFEGYLCCNMRTDGSWISDINYADGGMRIIPAGTPIKSTGYGRYRVYVEVEGTKQAIGNDYSRDIDMAAFAQRYIVKEDPRAKFATYPAKIREAIKTARVTRGMTREQALMSAGYPVSSENPSLDARVWRFWRDSFSEFQLLFDDSGKVNEIATDPMTGNLVILN
jgi:hypothetical protein